MSRHVHIYVGWEAYFTEGERLFGKKMNDWQIECPACGHIKKIGKKQGVSLVSRVKWAATTCDECLLFHGDIMVNFESWPDSLPVKNHLKELQRRRIEALSKPYSARILECCGENDDRDTPAFDFYRKDKEAA